VERTGVPIPTIFEIEGEDGFRRREAQTIHLTAGRDLVMATGGGCDQSENRCRLHEPAGWSISMSRPGCYMNERAMTKPAVAAC
jgi:shikimate kinase